LSARPASEVAAEYRELLAEIKRLEARKLPLLEEFEDCPDRGSVLVRCPKGHERRVSLSITGKWDGTCSERVNSTSMMGPDWDYCDEPVTWR